MNYYLNLSLENIVEEIDGIVHIEEWYKCDFTNYNDYHELGKFYEISSFGRVKSLKRNFIDREGKKFIRDERIIAQYKDKPRGYLHVTLSNYPESYTFLTHRLLLLCAEIPNPLSKETVNHKKGIKTDNRLWELEWATRSENVQHAFDMGLMTPIRGIDQWCHKLTEAQVKEIANDNSLYIDIAKRYNIKTAAVSFIKTGRNWSWLTGNSLEKNGGIKKGEDQSNSKLSNNDVIAISKASGTSCKIAKDYNVGSSTVRAIKLGQNWSWLTGIQPKLTNVS